jgi:hypothetical protein
MSGCACGDSQFEKLTDWDLTTMANLFTKIGDKGMLLAVRKEIERRKK